MAQAIWLRWMRALRHFGLTKAIAQVFDDRRRRASVSHSMRDLLAQRVYGLCCGWEDVCDHNVLAP